MAKYFITPFFLLLLFSVAAQKITVSSKAVAEREGVGFDIVGKVQNNILVYETRFNKHWVQVFDNQMQLKEKVRLDFFPNQTFNVDFIAYPDMLYVVYQYQKNSTLYCKLAKLDVNVNLLQPPATLDSVRLGFFTDNKVYNVAVSENKERFALYKLPKRAYDFNFSVRVFDKNLSTINNFTQKVKSDDRTDTYDNFSVDNQGNFIYTKEERVGNRPTTDKAFLYQIPYDSAKVNTVDFDLQNLFVENIYLKIDNINQRYLINSFYQKKGRGNVAGLFSLFVNAKTATIDNKTAFEITDDLRDLAKKGRQYRSAMDNYFIQQIILRKDGGFLLMAEDYSMQQNNNNINRFGFNNFNDPWGNYYYLNSFDYYGRRSMGSNIPTRYYTDNIMVFNVNKNNQVEWTRVIEKEQFDDGAEHLLSFGAIPFGGQLHFFYNSDDRFSILANQSITPAGIVNRNPTLRTEDKGYSFMPRYSKNISARQVIMPCNYRGYICYAKIEF
jgi:hypothetical protein